MIPTETPSPTQTDSQEDSGFWMPLKEYAAMTGKNPHTLKTQIHRKQRDSQKRIWNGKETTFVKVDSKETINESVNEQLEELKAEVEMLRNDLHATQIRNTRLETLHEMHEKEVMRLEDTIGAHKESCKDKERAIQGLLEKTAKEAATFDRTLVIEHKRESWMNRFMRFLPNKKAPD